MMQCAMRLVGVLVLVTACGHPPAAKPVTAEHPVTSVADIAGRWVTSDDMDWSYALELGADGKFHLAIDRNKLGACRENGKVAAGPAPQKFQITYETNDCNRDYAGAQMQLEVASFTGDSLTLVISGNGSQEKHVFTRAPAAQ